MSNSRSFSTHGDKKFMGSFQIVKSNNYDLENDRFSSQFRTGSRPEIHITIPTLLPTTGTKTQFTHPMY